MHPRRRHLVFILSASLVLQAGCAASMSSPGASESEPVSASETPSASESPSASADTDGSGAAPPGAPAGIPDEVWAAIVADLQRRLDGQVEGLTVVSATAQTWTDGSLGCPEPGQIYTQALVDGYQIVVEVEGQRYDFRIGSGTDVRLCESP
jgi:hypothetical protein